MVLYLALRYQARFAIHLKHSHPTNSLPMSRVPVELTFVTFEKGDLVGSLLASVSLVPLAVIISYASVIVFKRDWTAIVGLTGQLLNELLNALLKKNIQEPRPVGLYSSRIDTRIGKRIRDAIFACSIYGIFIGILRTLDRAQVRELTRSSVDCIFLIVGGIFCV